MSQVRRIAKRVGEEKKEKKNRRMKDEKDERKQRINHKKKINEEKRKIY